MHHTRSKCSWCFHLKGDQILGQTESQGPSWILQYRALVRLIDQRQEELLPPTALT